MTTTTIKLALDWTPNTNHTGFYVALALGYYKEENIELIIESPSDNYNNDETPARRVVNGNADMCIAPSESVISSFLSRDDNKIKPIAISTILQKDTSAIVTNITTIKTPKDLSNKRYASYAGRFEMNIVNELVKNDGGSNNVIEILPPKLDCFDAMLRGDADSTWIFLGWEGIQASRSNIILNTFPLPNYGYSPLLIANPNFVKNNNNILKKFLKCTEKGYQYAINEPEEAAKILYNTANHNSLHKLSLDFVIESQKFLSSGGYYLNDNGKWGLMDDNRWDNFIKWLIQNNCLYLNNNIIKNDDIDIQKLYTNELFY